jgi:hypothetical protein
MRKLLLSLGIMLGIVFGAFHATPAMAQTPPTCTPTTNQPLWAGNGYFFFCDPNNLQNQYIIIAGAEVTTKHQSTLLETENARFYVFLDLAAYQAAFNTTGGSSNVNDPGFTNYTIPRSVIFERVKVGIQYTLISTDKQIETAHHEVGHQLDAVWGGHAGHLSSQSAYEATVNTDWHFINVTEKDATCQGFLSQTDKETVCGSGTTPTGIYAGLNNEQILQKLYPHWLTAKDSPLWWELFAQEYSYNWTRQAFPIDFYMPYFKCSLAFVYAYIQTDAAPTGTCTNP